MAKVWDIQSAALDMHNPCYIAKLTVRWGNPVPIELVQNDVFGSRQPDRLAKPGILEASAEHFPFKRDRLEQPEIRL